MQLPFLGYGVGLRPKHYNHILTKWPEIDFFEIISENYMVDGGRPIDTLEKIRERYPVVMHGVSLSIGSTDPLDKNYLKRLKKLADKIKPAWISDHLCWAGVGGNHLHDLLPLPYTEETLKHVTKRIRQVQEYLERPLVIENVSSYMNFTESSMTEWNFVTAVARESNSLILLDVNNVYVSAFNHGFDAKEYIQAIPKDRVVQMHLAGHSRHKDYILDTHDHPINNKVWQLYEFALRRFGRVTTLIEWDDKIPSFPRLYASAQKAKSIGEAICGKA